MLTPRVNSQHMGVAIVIVSTIAWATAGLFVRLLPHDIWSIIVWRNLFGILFVGGFVLWKFGRRTLGVIRGLGYSGALATACSTLTIIAFPAAFQHASVANVVTIYTALPFVTAAIAWVWLRERPSIPTLLAGGLALAGIVIMVGPSAGGPQLGDFLSLLSTISMALMTLIIRRYGKVEMLPVALLSIMASGVIALPLASQLSGFTSGEIAIAAGFALVPLTLGLMLYVIGSAMIPATLAALIGTMEAPFGVFWVWLAIGEKPPMESLIGGSLIFTAVIGRLLYDWHSARPA